MTATPQDSLRLSSQLYAHVPPGEEVLWSGRPDPAVMVAEMDVVAIPVSVLWCAIVAFATYKVMSDDPVNGISMSPFLAYGGYTLVGRFAYKRYRKRKTLYALTSDYVITIVGRRVSVDRISHMQALTSMGHDGQHMNTTFMAPDDPRALWVGGRMPWRTGSVGYLFGNMGMELLNRGKSPLAFYDIADADALLSALKRSNAVTINAGDAADTQRDRTPSTAARVTWRRGRGHPRRGMQ